MLLGAGFVYFQATLRSLWISIPLALALTSLVAYMFIKLGKRKSGWGWRAGFKRPKLRLVSRKRAPWCALYGALYLTLYLALGYAVYLPLSLVLLLLAGLGFGSKRPPEPEQTAPAES